MQERLITLNVDKAENKIKPIKKEIGAIQKRIGECKTTLTTEELVNWINKGATIKAAALDGNKNSDWVSQEIFCLDFDNDDKEVDKYGYITPEIAIKRCEEYGIQPAFYYTSFSSAPEHIRFRLVFINRDVIGDIRLRNVVQLGLMKIFPESDKACKDLSRIFFGSNNGCQIVDIDNTIDPLNVINGVEACLRATDPKNSTRLIKDYFASVGLNTINGGADVKIVLNTIKNREYYKNVKNEENERRSILLYIEHRVNPLKLTIFNFNINNDDYSLKIQDTEGKAKAPKINITDTKVKAPRLIEDFDFEQLEHNCLLYGEFMSGDIKHHEEIFGMATNLWRYKGAQSNLIDVIDNNPEYKGKANKINTIRYAAKAQYEPMQCQNFCPYANNCPNKGKNMLAVIDIKRNAIRKLEDIPEINLNDAFEATSEAIADAISSTENSITIIKAPTGIGKSTIVREIAKINKDLFENTVYAAPNHTLLEELVNKINPDLPTLLHVTAPEITNETVAATYFNMLATGQYGAAKGVLEDHVNKLLGQTINNPEAREEVMEEVNSINKHLINSKEARTTNKPIFCTHQRLFHLNNKNIDKYIVDEDIIPALVQNIEITKEAVGEIAQATLLAQMHKLDATHAALYSLSRFIEDVNNAPANTIVEYKNQLKIIDVKEIKQLLKLYTPHCNFFNLLSIKAAIKAADGTITAYIKNNIPNKPIIVLSATANLEVYKAIFKDRTINMVNVGNVEHKGHIIFHYMGMSRTYLNKNFNKAVVTIKNEASGINNIITFAKMESKFKAEGFNTIAHFGKCTGIDAYNGQDLIVAGTPHLNVAAYLLLAHACGVRDNIVVEQEFVPVVRNGFEFSFSTFSNNNLSKVGELIREIQFYLIEGELVQAIGRARALRNNCTVHVFSNLPLPNMELYNN